MLYSRDWFFAGSYNLTRNSVDGPDHKVDDPSSPASLCLPWDTVLCMVLIRVPDVQGAGLRKASQNGPYACMDAFVTADQLMHAWMTEFCLRFASSIIFQPSSQVTRRFGSHLSLSLLDWYLPKGPTSCEASIGFCFPNFLFLLRSNLLKVHNEFLLPPRSSYRILSTSQKASLCLLPWKAILNDFQVKLIFKICCQVFYLVSNPLNSKAYETAIAAGIGNFLPWLQGR